MDRAHQNSRPFSRTKAVAASPGECSKGIVYLDRLAVSYSTETANVDDLTLRIDEAKFEFVIASHSRC